MIINVCRHIPWCPDEYTIYTLQKKNKIVRSLALEWKVTVKIILLHYLQVGVTNVGRRDTWPGTVQLKEALEVVEVVDLVQSHLGDSAADSRKMVKEAAGEVRIHIICWRGGGGRFVIFCGKEHARIQQCILHYNRSPPEDHPIIMTTYVVDNVTHHVLCFSELRPPQHQDHFGFYRVFSFLTLRLHCSTQAPGISKYRCPK